MKWLGWVAWGLLLLIMGIGFVLQPILYRPTVNVIITTSDDRAEFVSADIEPVLDHCQIERLRHEAQVAAWEAGRE